MRQHKKMTSPALEDYKDCIRRFLNHCTCELHCTVAEDLTALYLWLTMHGICGLWGTITAAKHHIWELINTAVHIYWYMSLCSHLHTVVIPIDLNHCCDVSLYTLNNVWKLLVSQPHSNTTMMIENLRKNTNMGIQSAIMLDINLLCYNDSNSCF